MASFKNLQIKDWVAGRILDFLNRVKTVEDITESDLLQDDPNSGGENGTTIGVTVAERILNKRNNMRFPRFRNLSELEDIQGLGEDKMRDFVFSFSKPAADAFVTMMYNGIIMDNWELTHHTTYFETEQAFKNVASNFSNFKSFVADQIKQQSLQQNNNYQLAQQKAVLLEKSYVEIFDVEHYGAIALGFWFYQFDADNWFSFEKIRAVCEQYLSYHATGSDRQELRLFKGFRQHGFAATSTSQGVLPVVVNYPEMAISIWDAVLND